MTDLRVTTLTGGDILLQDSAVEEFEKGLRGQLLRPGDEGYDEARKVWNGMIDRRPGLIARCAGVADVIHSVNFARTHNLLVAVRGGGHNVAGNATCNGGLVIDLSCMKGIRVDPIGRTVRAEGGVTWGEFDLETQAFGLATTGGIVSTTGIAGLTLGGGLGWLSRRCGLASDNLLSADIVTADGKFLTASATEHEDLFWGLRGGGGNFGVVTSLEYRLHVIGPTVLAGMVVHPFEKAKEILKFYREFTSTEPDELTSYAALGTLPGGDPVAAIFVCYNGPIEEGEKILRPLKEFGPPVADQVHPMVYREVQSMLDSSFPSGQQHYWKSNFLKGLSDDAIDTMVAYCASRPSPMSHGTIEELGGAVNQMGQEETAFNHRDARYSLLILGISPDPVESDKCIRWAREFWEAMQPFSSGGVYVNYLGQEAEEGAGRVKAAYGANYERLVALKNRYDPTNLFRHNQNIKPMV
ncbi:MAG: FAD-binding oxidoreductase [Deltaproteobacteria bacterium]|nr:FAD-binding oxidoreductase [Deltaproteobacteria bacterium]